MFDMLLNGDLVYQFVNFAAFALLVFSLAALITY